MRMLQSFWTALEDLPCQATDRRDWQAISGEAWPVASTLLRQTGTLATAVDCPSPGGDGCPRRVVHHRDGRIVAVCGECPARCDRLDLARSDIEILELDRRQLAGELVRLVSLHESPGMARSAPLALLGSLPVRAGLGVPVLFGIPAPDGAIERHHVAAACPHDDLGLLLTPTGRRVGSLPDGWVCESLAELLGTDGRHLAALPAAERRLDVLRRSAATAFAPKGGPAWELPADAAWEEMTLVLKELEVLLVSYGNSSRRFEPAELDMLDRRKKRPKLQWTVLRGLAEAGGRLPRPRGKDAAKSEKQIQQLSQTLSRAFGISTPPLALDKHSREYVARFVIRSELPKSLRMRGADEDR